MSNLDTTSKSDSTSKASGHTSARGHTVVMSDLHLTDMEPGAPGRSLWKRYKRPKFFIDQSFRRLLQYFTHTIKDGPIELVLNGDIFDFDSVMRLPLHSGHHISWLERKRGLNPEEEKSRFKMEVILGDHFVWVEAVREFILKGNSVVFVIGNHDIELHWPLVQKEVRKALRLPPEFEHQVRFCEWFYVSNNDTMIEHGNQYDDYCVASNPIHPLVKMGKSVQMRLPFGNITSRYMVNGMGLFNPHAESSFIMSPAGYFRFFYKYAIRVQPLLLLTWIWSATASFWIALTEGVLPAMKDPLFTEQRVQEIAEKANVTPTQVRMLNELHVHPAVFNPIKIARELWLDRVLILFVIGFLSFELFAIVNIVVPISWLWFITFFIIFFPLLIYYSRDIKSQIIQSMEEAFRQVPTIAKIVGVKRVIFGHTHRELHTYVDQTEVLNTGTWSPAFTDPECRVSFGKKCFAWIKSDNTCGLYVWKDPDLEMIQVKK